MNKEICHPPRCDPLPAPAAAAAQGGDFWQALEHSLQTQSQTPPPVSVPRGRPLPLSFAQEGVWLAHLTDPGCGAYNVPLGWRLDGPLAVAALEQSLRWLIGQHEILRSRVESVAGLPAQLVGEVPARPLRLVCFEDQPPGAREAAVAAWLAGEIRRPFNLAAEPMLRPSLLRLGAEQHVLLVVFHHLAIDAWSQRVLLREWSLAYRAFREGQTAAGPTNGWQSADFAAWQRRCWTDAVWQPEREFWLAHLANPPPPLELPFDQRRPAYQSFRGGTHRFTLEPQLLAALDELRRTTGATRHALLLAAFTAFLHRYTAQPDLVVGTPVALRGRAEFRDTIGFLLNLQALRLRPDAGMSFADLAADVNRTALAALAHPNVPFEKLVAELHPGRTADRTPLLQTVFVYQNVPGRNPGFSDVRVTPLALHNGTAKFDLLLQIEEAPDATGGFWEFNADLFAPETIARMAGHFQTLLHAALQNPGQRLAGLPLLSSAERQRVVVEWNLTRTEYPRERCIHQLFEEQAHRTPGALALVSGGDQLTFRQLNYRANRLAVRLRDLGVGPDAPVALALERSPGLVVAMLAILKAGGAYVPLDADQPTARLAQLLADTRPPVLITTRALSDRLPPHPATLLLLDELPDSDEPAPDLPCLTDPGRLACVIYTSGSTGTPKGAAIPHRGVVRLVRHTNYANLGADEVFLLFAPVTFDASTFEIWAPLLNGGRLVLMPPGTDSLRQLGTVIRQHGVTTLWLTAGLFNLMVDDHLEELRGLRQLLTGGEVLSVTHVERALAALPGCRLVNAYGPTENTTFTTCHTIRAEDLHRGSIPIGQPIANTTVFVLDPLGQPAPIGVPGELFTGGDGLARGYLNQPELTREKFVADPFRDDPGARLYRTGDRVRWRADGTLEFLGRLDRQFKLRGFRIEPGEIESQLNACPGVQRCVVELRADGPGPKRLVAYVVPQPGLAPEPAKWSDHLKHRLPEFMWPSAFVTLDRLPLTAGGKVDRRALPMPTTADTDGRRLFVAPRDAWERELAALWEKILGVSSLSVTDDFFALGGHSLLAARMFDELDREFGLHLPLAMLFEAPTVEQLAAAVRRRRQNTAWQSLVPIQPHGTRPPIFWVHTLGGGGGGGLLRYRALATELGPDQPSFGIEAPHEPFTDIRRMASAYLEALRSMQPRGPYFLGGYCFGANVAFEMACQLEAHGEPVALLALLEAMPPETMHHRTPLTPRSLPEFARNLAFWLADFFRRPPPVVGADLRRLWRKLLTGRSATPRPLALSEVLDLSQYPAGFRRFAEVHYRAMQQYQPGVFHGPITLFRTRTRPVLNFDPLLGWGPHAAGGVTVKVVPGHHETFLEAPWVRVLADQFRSALAAAQLAPARRRA